MSLRIKQIKYWVVGSCLLLLGSTVAAKTVLPHPAYNGTKLLMGATSFTYTENMPIDAFLNDFKGDYPVDGKYAFTHNQAFIGFGYSGVEFEVFSRLDYFFRTNYDTFKLIYMDKNKIDFPINEVFDAYLHVQQIEGEGARLGYRFNLDKNIEVYLGGSYFESQDALYGFIEGQIWQDTDRPRGDLESDYIYNKEYILKRPLTPPGSGYGYGFDVDIKWQLTDALIFNAEFNDIAGRIDWKHAPHTTLVMVSDRNRIDEHGKPYKVPTLSGRHDFVERTQPLPLHHVLSMDYRFARPYVVSFERETYDRLSFTRLLASYQPARWFRVEVGHDFDSDANSLELWTPYASLLLATDSINEKQAKNARAELRFGYGL